MIGRYFNTKPGRFLLFTASALLLSACNASNSGNTNNTLDVGADDQKQAVDESINLRAYCPKTVLRAGTETYRVYAKGVKKGDPGALSSLRFQSTITEVVRECNYRSDHLNLRVGIAGRAINGPTGDSGTFDMPIRVAVTRGDEVLYSQLHIIPATIPPGGSFTAFRYVDGNVNFPIPDKSNLLVYVGFDEGPYEEPLAIPDEQPNETPQQPAKKLQPIN